MHCRDDIARWRISHFLLYFVLALMTPKLWYWLLLAGLVWEVIECQLGKVQFRSMQKKSKSKSKKEKKTDYGKKWMAGTSADVVFNVGGLLVGYGIYYLFARYVFKVKA